MKTSRVLLNGIRGPRGAKSPTRDGTTARRPDGAARFGHLWLGCFGITCSWLVHRIVATQGPAWAVSEGWRSRTTWLGFTPAADACVYGKTESTGD